MNSFSKKNKHFSHHHFHEQNDLVTGTQLSNYNSSVSQVINYSVSPQIDLNVTVNTETGEFSGINTASVENITNLSRQPEIIAGGKGRYKFYLKDDSVTDWGLVLPDRRPDKIISIGEEDRIGVLGAKSIFIGGKRGRISIKNEKKRIVGYIRDHDISLEEARSIVIPLPNGNLF